MFEVVGYSHGNEMLALIGLFYFILFCINFYQDWGLFDMSSKVSERNTFLREELLYPNKSFYYVCIVLDFILRCVWVISLMPQTSSLIGPSYSICFASLEIFRRAMWGFLRVEWEQVQYNAKNTVGFGSSNIMKKVKVKKLNVIAKISTMRPPKVHPEN